MKHIFISILILCSVPSFSQVKKYIKKATRATEKSHFMKAREYYLKAYAIDKTNYNANEGLGVVLAEFMERYDEAIPYLEYAFYKSPKDTSIDVVYALGKSYEYTGQYEKALAMFARLKNTTAVEDDDRRYQMDIRKRIEDCQYGLSNANTPSSTDFYIINAGPVINTAMPEYVPVITPNNELIFTSRRQDTPDEKLQKEDGKYYESMYLSELKNGRPQGVRRYTVPDLYMKSKFKKHHESVVSMSPDGKTLYVFRDSKIYEVSTDALTKTEPKKLAKSVNFNYYQSHAYLSKDRKTLLFTSESDKGLGGIDIYKTTKGENGEWLAPENLGAFINTAYDEDAPYLSDDGNTLYFASKGHPGFGNFDLYKSELKNGSWSEPVNLGAPVNSAGHDIFLYQDNARNAAYFSSSRKGGFGDMDIYKINYLTNLNQECVNASNPLLSINKTILDSAKALFKFEPKLAPQFKPLKYQWSLNNTAIGQDNKASAEITDRENDNTVALKIIAYCDTCYEPLAICNSIKLNLKELLPVKVIEDDIVTNPYDPQLKYSYLSKRGTAAIGLNLTPVHFNLNKSNLRDDAIEILNKNAVILTQHREISVLIYGFADSRGADAYNERLSKTRAMHVKQYLVSKGVNNKQIKLVSGKGEKFLLNNCSNGVECDETQHEQNRRVELLLVEKEIK